MRKFQRFIKYTVSAALTVSMLLSEISFTVNADWPEAAVSADNCPVAGEYTADPETAAAVPAAVTSPAYGAADADTVTAGGTDPDTDAPIPEDDESGSDDGAAASGDDASKSSEPAAASGDDGSGSNEETAPSEDDESGVTADPSVDPDEVIPSEYAEDLCPADDTGTGSLGAADLSLAVSWDEPAACGTPTVFRLTASGGSDSPSYKYALWGIFDSENNMVYDTSRNTSSAYSTSDTYSFTFYASGTYKVRFTVMDMNSTPLKYVSSKYYSITINDPDYPSLEERVASIASDCLDYCRSHETDTGYSADFTKALYMNDWLVSHCSYDNSLRYCSAEGALARGSATCEGYHRAYVKLCNSVGLETGRIEGNGHVWTAVKMDGSWYQTDTTWDDPGYTSASGPDLNRLYFGLNDSITTLVHSDHTPQSGYESDSLTDNYFIKSGAIHTYSDPYKAAVKEHLDKGESSFSISVSDSSCPEVYRNVIMNLAAYQLSTEDWGSGRSVSASYSDNLLTFSCTYSDFTVILHANGGTFGESDTLELTVPSGTSLDDAAPALPVKTGRKLSGWSTDEAGESTFDTSVGITADLDLYAVWDTSSYNRQVQPVTAMPGAAGECTYIDPGTKIALSCATPDAAVYYTIGTCPEDTDVPTVENSVRYTEPIIPVGDTVIRAFAVKNSFEDSDVVTLEYALNDVSEYSGDVTESDLPGTDDQSTAERVSQIPSGLWVSAVPDQVYTGKAVKPAVNVYYGSKKLTASKDYRLTYSNNTKPGTASISAIGKGDYAGSTAVQFTITKADISDIFDAIPDSITEYNSRKAQRPAISITYNGLRLSEGKDYVISISDKTSGDHLTESREPGTYIYTISAAENSAFSGTGTAEFTILKAGQVNMKNVSVRRIPDQPWTGQPVELTASDLKVTDKAGNQLEPGKDYTVRYITGKNAAGNNTDAGKAQITLVGTGTDYFGSKALSFLISGGLNISSARISGIEQTDGYDTASKGFIYSGSAYEPAGPASESDPDGTSAGSAIVEYRPKKGAPYTTLQKGTDYLVSYQKNINTGTAYIIFTGIGHYTGVRKVSFRIVASDINDSAGLDISLMGADSGDNSYKYIKGGVYPEVSVSFDGTELVCGKDYSVSYSNNKKVCSADAVNKNNRPCGPAVYITGRGNYKGKSGACCFSIVPEDISELSISAADRTCTGKVKSFSTAVTITDTNSAKGTKLSGGTDYDKNLTYTYYEDTDIQRYVSSRKTAVSVSVPAGSTVKNSDIIPAGTPLKVTAAGMGNYTGSISQIYRITNYDISGADVRINDQKYKGKAVEPGKNDISRITLRINGKTRQLNAADYEITGYTRNTGKGTGYMTIHGLGAYGGYKTVSFRIKAAD